MSNVLIAKFELRGDAAHAVEQLFARSGDTSIGVLSLVLLVFSGVSLTRRLQKMYLQAWRLDRPPGVRASLNAAVGLVALLLEIALLSLLRKLVSALPLDWVLGVPLSLLVSLALWTTVPWLLLDRRVSFRRLLPAGGLTAVAAGVYGLVSTVYMPRTMETYSQRYGLFGVTVALVGWLLCSALILVAATVVAAEADRAPEAWARRLRGRWGLGPDGPTAEVAEVAEIAEEPVERPPLILGEGRPAHQSADRHP